VSCTFLGHRLRQLFVQDQGTRPDQPDGGVEDNRKLISFKPLEVYGASGVANGPAISPKTHIRVDSLRMEAARMSGAAEPAYSKPRVNSDRTTLRWPTLCNWRRFVARDMFQDTEIIFVSASRSCSKRQVEGFQPSPAKETPNQ